MQTRHIVAAAAVLGLVACSGDQATNPTPTPPVDYGAALLSNANNGHYGLYKVNVIGVPKQKSAEMTGDQGKRMFVPLSGTTKIYLQEGDFDVLDANATDGYGLFQLPDPDPDDDGETWYGMFVRTLGKPGGSATLQSCAEGDFDLTLPGNETLCSTETMVVTREAGKPRVYNVSKELLTVCLNLDDDPACDLRSFLFDDDDLDYLWNWTTNGLRLAQVYFLEIPQDIGVEP